MMADFVVPTSPVAMHALNLSASQRVNSCDVQPISAVTQAAASEQPDSYWWVYRTLKMYCYYYAPAHNRRGH